MNYTWKQIKQAIEKWLNLNKQPPMNFHQLVSELCARERGEKQVNAAQMSEVVRHLKDLIKENESITGNRVIECLRK